MLLHSVCSDDFYFNISSVNHVTWELGVGVPALCGQHVHAVQQKSSGPNIRNDRSFN
jgi:hypothetical protein